MPAGLFQKIAAFLKWPVGSSVFMIILTYFKQNFPVLQNFAICLPEVKPCIIYMIGFCTTTIEFEDRIVLPFFQVIKCHTFHIITAIIEFIGVMANIIEYFMQFFIGKMMQIDKP